LTIQTNFVHCHRLQASSNTLDGENKTQFTNKSKESYLISDSKKFYQYHRALL
jgi:DeoR/GlpR family transcriptional regulator of sugar metabolism